MKFLPSTESQFTVVRYVGRFSSMEEEATECVGSFQPNAFVVNTNAFAVDEEIHT